MDPYPPVAPPPAPLRPLSPAGAIAGGWRAFLARPWPLLGVLLVFIVLQVVGQFIPFLNLVFALLVTPALYAGGAWYFLRSLRGENPPFEVAFEGFQRWPSVTGVGLLVFVVALAILAPMIVVLVGAVGLSALLASRPGHTPDFAPAAMLPFFASMAIVYPLLFWWSARSYLAFFVVMEADRPGAMEALRRSFQLTRGSVWRMLGLYLLWIPISIVGLLALCLGILPAAAVCYLSLAHAYEQLRARAAR